MNDHDRQLFEAAWRTPYTQWHDIHPEDAETEEGRAELDYIQARKYRQEEYYAGIA